MKDTAKRTPASDPAAEGAKKAKTSVQKFRILAVTDHSKHHPYTADYAIFKEMVQDERCEVFDVVSRGLAANDAFFKDCSSTELTVRRVLATEDYSYSKEGKAFTDFPTHKTKLREYDVLLVRLARPTPPKFYTFLTTQFPEKRMINSPSGILKCGSKQYLLKLSHLMGTPVKLIKNLEDLERFRKTAPECVLKPLENSGGKGLIRITGTDLYFEGEKTTYEAGKEQLVKELATVNHIAVKFLKNVSQGDKRVTLCYGKVVASSLRIPHKDSWLCNGSQGGSSHKTTPDERELEIGKELSEDLLKHGVVFFGFDTLVGDDGKRVLSEINASNVSGLLQAEEVSGLPVIKTVAQQLLNYMSDFNLRNV